MILIEKADQKDATLLSEIATATFLESHGHSASPEDIRNYIEEKYGSSNFEKELLNPDNNYYLIYHQDRLAGFSNIIFNAAEPGAGSLRAAKLERIYILKEFYDLKLGFKLLEFNINLAKQDNQEGIWLFVWKENQRAINFYRKNGFVVIGSYDFKISERHSNPNHQMFLKI